LIANFLKSRVVEVDYFVASKCLVFLSTPVVFFILFGDEDGFPHWIVRSH